MNVHNCPGLASCVDHPRWRVTVRPGRRSRWGDWYGVRLTLHQVYPPFSGTFEAAYMDHAEAMTIATGRARRDQLNAIQNAVA